MTESATTRRTPNPTVIRAVVAALRAGHTTAAGLVLHSGYSSPTVNAALAWLREQGCVRTTKERPPRVPGKAWRGLSHWHALIAAPSLPEDGKRTPVPGARVEPWDFSALLACRPLGSRPANMPAGRVHRMGD